MYIILWKYNDLIQTWRLTHRLVAHIWERSKEKVVEITFNILIKPWDMNTINSCQKTFWKWRTCCVSHVPVVCQKCKHIWCCSKCTCFVQKNVFIFILEKTHVLCVNVPVVCQKCKHIIWCAVSKCTCFLRIYDA